MGTRRHRVVALVRAPQSPFELGCAADVFGTARPGVAGRYDFTVCTEHPGPVPTTAGYDMVVPHGLSALARADTVVIPGWLPVETPLSPALTTALRTAHRRGARLVSICTGAFALAQTGLLDGRRATTHWAGADRLRELFPRVLVDPDVLYIDHGDVATSAGAGAGIDLCLHLVRADHGAAHAAALARSMVMPPHREGGQAQFVTPPSAPRPEGSLAELLDWCSARLHTPIGIDDMAAHLRISPRTLARRFAEQLGTSPGRWLLTQRINATRALLEDTDLSVDAIAVRVGLGSATNLRRRFHGALRTTPAGYRRAFRNTETSPLSIRSGAVHPSRS
ncbi:helix-turn-helix domain-containing protein [Pseudonocardia acaciae]|uniref:helix-turn-helix domain-containing protein n=1 Tax=Pseudonocardia acaciae TaxID=551276 RepID=UPI0006854B77|nr:helix-turn-helix domain-containing protein [Pseudonocardia acaciae]